MLRIGGVGSDTVGEGVIASLPKESQADVIYASVSSATPGSVLITIFGEIIGMVTADTALLGADAYTVFGAPEAPPVTNAAPNT